VSAKKKIDEYKILIIDDNLNTLDIYRRYFEFYGFTVISAQKGREALSKVMRERPDIVILDVMLPDIDGFEVTKQIREFNTVLPIIMITAKVDHNDKIRGFMSGAHRYLTKPCSPDKVLKEIKKLLNLKGELLNELDKQNKQTESNSDTVELPPFE